MEYLINKIMAINSKSDFEELSLNLFDFQMKNNPIYTQYSSLILKNKTPKNIFEIPFLPIEFFKKEQIICKGKTAEEIFLSSGTTGEQSKHLVADLSLYKKSYLRAFQQFYGDIDDYCILALLPSYKEQESSSLIFMIDNLIQQSSHQKSGYYLNNYSELSDTIKELEKKKEKTILFGVTYALLDFAKEFPQQLKNTIVMETGGMKGQQKEMLKEEVYKILKHSFVIKNIHSEYGMTELLSQSYSKGNNLFNSPPWMKIIIRDVNDPLSIIGHNKTGGINVIDLANIYSCPFIATQDLGRTFNDDSFSVLGRFDNSDVRGCNLLVQ
jgi:hypothetical protein|tara:strand:- start:80 stop:1057 length:978 start_codon:yes stop_codon:yes gene_type:complete